MQHHDELTPRSLAGKRTIHEGCMPQLRQLGTYSCLPSSAHWSPCSIGRPMTTSVQSAIYAESRALGHQIQAIKHGLLSQNISYMIMRTGAVSAAVFLLPEDNMLAMRTDHACKRLLGPTGACNAVKHRTGRRRHRWTGIGVMNEYPNELV